MELTHASFFSGVGGLDLGLARAGWQTVSHSEIDPYANAVLAEHWPAIPNLGDITDIARWSADDPRWRSGRHGAADPRAATLWSGGFPCQDLSVAGKRAGLAGARSGLAFAFLDLVERHRPPAILLENVPGLLSSHKGRDFGALLARLGELGYGWAYRILDAQYFGVPQRRRRVFIVALHSRLGLGADGPGEVLSVGSRCDRHPATGGAPRTPTHGVAADGAATSRTVQAAFGHHGRSIGAQDADGGYLQTSPALTSRQERFNHPGDQAYVGALRAEGKGYPVSAGDEDRLIIGALREHVRPGSNTDHSVLVNAVRAGHHGDPGIGRDGDERRLILSSSPPDSGRVRAADGLAGWLDDSGAVAPLLSNAATSPAPHIIGAGPQDDPLLPLGLDSHRYRCCGNGVVSNVAEWIGLRLAEVLS